MNRFRRNKRNSKIIISKDINLNVIVILILIIIISLFALFIRNLFTQKKYKEYEEAKKTYLNEILFISEQEIQTEKEDVPIEEIKREVSIDLVSLGNIMCETPILADGKKQDGTYSFTHIFEDIKKYIDKSDIAIGNLETCFVQGEYVGRGKYNTPKQFAIDLKAIGIDILNTANNNIYNYGEEGLNSTIDTLREVGIENVGTKKQDESSIVVKEIQGIEIAFLSYTYGLNGIQNITNELYENVNIISKEKILEDLKQVQNVDYICVNLHWGSGSATSPNEEQKQLADFLFENGVDLVLGTHSPYLQLMEVKKNKQDEDVFIAYGVGNFISISGYNEKNVEMILNIKITKDIEDNTFLSKVTYTPIYLLDNGSETENRYKLLDVKEEVNLYESGAKDRISEKVYKNLLKALENIEKQIGK